MWQKIRLEILLILVCFLVPADTLTQEKYLHFTEIDGLPRNIATSLEQDRYGYTWIGTASGIARYDGNEFALYDELSGVSVIDLLIDDQNTLWAATDIGLFRYNRLTDFFELRVDGYITKLQKDQGSLYYLLISGIYRYRDNESVLIYQGNEVNDFCIADEGIWFSKGSDGLRLLSRKSGFEQVTDGALMDRSVYNIIAIDTLILAGCYNGDLYVLLKNRESVRISIENHYFFKKMVRIGREIWMATDGNGIIILDEHLRHRRTLNRNPAVNSTIQSNSIYDILQGSSGEIWIATYGAGLTCILPDNLLFRNFLPEKGNPNSLIANEGMALHCAEPYIYFGTNYGLSVWNSHSGEFRNMSRSRLISELKGAKVTALHVDRRNMLWVGTYDGLLGVYDSRLELVATYHPSSRTSDEMQQIVHLHELNNDRILVLTQFQELILLNFNTLTEKSEVFELYRKGSGQTYCLLNSIRENQDGELLALISDQGLFHINWENNVLENKLDSLNERIGSYVSDFYQDLQGNYWFASSTTGLIKISDEGRDYRNWTMRDGLPSNTLIRIESVDDRFLWISTISGICRFDMHTEEMLNYNYTDGLPANEYYERSSCTTPEGEIIFGSLAGFTMIDPSKVTPDTSVAHVIISDISFQGQSIRSPSGKIRLDKPLEELNRLVLPYSRNSFTINFFTKTRSYKKAHSYAYQMIGLEENVNFTERTNFATYTNLSPGTYTFEIRSTDKTLQSKPTHLTIVIRPPWYLAWYAFLAYIMVFLAIVLLSVYAYLKRLQLSKNKEITEYKIQKEHELTEKKMAFFTSISHDLKTPLTLIDAPVSDLLESGELNAEQRTKLLIIRRNSRRLYKLITDLLDFRRISQKKYVLKVRNTLIAGVLSDVVLAFEEECRNKSISIECQVPEGLKACVDEGKIEKILWNLVSNAIKFTGKNSRIYLQARETVDNDLPYLQLMVRDKGIGIPSEKINRIFDRFYKIEENGDTNPEGTGIGLSIVKELVELHHGAISVQSEIGIGTTFTIRLPAHADQYDDNEKIPGEVAYHQVTGESSGEPAKPATMSPDQKKYNLDTILIVEDNSELREYLAEHFRHHYRVSTAEDGMEGFTMAKKTAPDLILTDVQMPRMDGYAFCQTIRNDFDTSHIPVVMLTANDSVGQQVQGLSTGADIYITKPFDIHVLDAQIRSAIGNRKTLRKRFRGVEPTEGIRNALPPRDIEFIDELNGFIEKNITLQELTVKLLAEHFAVSLAQLHRKIKALLDTTPNNLIKTIRLNKAYKLISEDGLRVSEAAYQTGFNDPNYFTICFKQQFGQNPSQISRD